MTSEEKLVKLGFAVPSSGWSPIVVEGVALREETVRIIFELHKEDLPRELIEANLLGGSTWVMRFGDHSACGAGSPYFKAIKALLSKRLEVGI